MSVSNIETPTMANLQEPWTRVSDNGDISLTVQAKPGEDQTTIHSQLVLPAVMSEWAVHGQIDRDEVLPGEALPPSVELIYLVVGGLEPHIENRRYQGLLSALGYEAAKETEQLGGGKVAINTHFTYPSLQILNAAARRLFPQSYDFVNFEGGLYDSGAFMNRLRAEPPGILAADTQPYQLHEHAYHTIGWLALDPGSNFMQRTLSVIDYHAERSDNPESVEFLAKIMEKLDSVTADITRNMLLSETNNKASLARTLQRFWLREPLVRLPMDSLDPGANELEELRAVADAMWARFDKADASIETYDSKES